jgi:hypothetical protein
VPVGLLNYAKLILHGFLVHSNGQAATAFPVF